MTGLFSVFSTPVWRKPELQGEAAETAAARCEKWNTITSLYTNKFIYRLADRSYVRLTIRDLIKQELCLG